MKEFEAIANQAAIISGQTLMQLPKELIPFMEFLSKENEINCFLEIGMCNGATFYVWSQLAQRGALKLGIDLPNGPWGTGIKLTEKELLQKKQLLQSIAPNSHVLFADSAAQSSVKWVEEKLKGKQIDFLFIDGDHSYVGVKTDYNNYSPFVKPGGIIAFHDIKDTAEHTKANCFVSDFWKEFTCNKQEFTDWDYLWGGIGVLKK